MKIQKTKIENLKVIKLNKIKDLRGIFLEIFVKKNFYQLQKKKLYKAIYLLIKKNLH